MEDDCSSTVLTRTASSSALTLIETAHPVFGPVRKLWSSPTQSHQVVYRHLLTPLSPPPSRSSLSMHSMQICAVLAAVSEVVRSREGKGTETEYFGALVSSDQHLHHTNCTYLSLSLSSSLSLHTLDVCVGVI